MYLRLDEPAAVKDDSAQMLSVKTQEFFTGGKNFLTCLYYKSAAEESQNKFIVAPVPDVDPETADKGRKLRLQQWFPSLRNAVETDILKEINLCVYRGKQRSNHI